MITTLTAKQKIVLAAIANLTHQNGRPPTLEQIRNALNYQSISSVQRHTDALKRKGYLDAGRGLALAEYSAMKQIPLVGNIAAGTPFLAIENVEAYVPYPSSRLPGNPDDYFLLRAVGDSMNATSIAGKNIDDGDIVLVKKQGTANSGERVVALIGDDATIKKLSISKEFVELRPETTNPQNKPIYIFESLVIQGVVKDVLKKGEK